MLSRPDRTVAILLLAGACSVAAAAEWVDAPLSPETWWEQGAEWKTQTVDIPLAAGMALEHMLRMNEGDMIVYNWTVAMDEPALLTAEFHGHTEQAGDEPGTVMFYTKHKDGKESGSLRAPFTGVHGWYLNNESEQDIVVRLEVAGYFSE
ncbi:MAG TPA: hypothetical protein VGE69_04055 [Pseudomonadales bacterium]